MIEGTEERSPQAGYRPRGGYYLASISMDYVGMARLRILAQDGEGLSRTVRKLVDNEWARQNRGTIAEEMAKR